MIDPSRKSEVNAASRRSSPPDATLALSIDPSGRWMCVCQRGALHILSADSGPIPLVPADGEPLRARSARFSGMGKLVTAGDDKLVRVWDVTSATCLRSWLHHKKVACVQLSSDGQTILFADRFGEVYSVALDGSEATPVLILGHLSPISHLRLSPTGSELLTADREGHVRNRSTPSRTTAKTTVCNDHTIDGATDSSDKSPTTGCRMPLRSAYPHAFVINEFYMHHTSPVQIMLPLVQLLLAS